MRALGAKARRLLRSDMVRVRVSGEDGHVRDSYSLDGWREVLGVVEVEVEVEVEVVGVIARISLLVSTRPWEDQDGWDAVPVPSVTARAILIPPPASKGRLCPGPANLSPPGHDRPPVPRLRNWLSSSL